MCIYVLYKDGESEKAARNFHHGLEIVKLLLARAGNDFQVTEGVVEAAAGNINLGPDIVAVLLAHPGCNICITAPTIEATARNKAGCREILDLIAQYQGDELAELAGLAGFTVPRLTLLNILDTQGPELIWTAMIQRAERADVTKRMVDELQDKLLSGRIKPRAADHIDELRSITYLLDMKRSVLILSEATQRFHLFN